MSRALALASLVALLSPSVTARADRYTLRAELDVDRHVVRGEARIVFVNTSRAPLTELVFHLYMNAFNGDPSVFMRESHGALRGVRGDGGHAGIRVTEMRVGAHDLLRGAETTLVPDDRTQLRAHLPTPLAPGASITIDARFVTTLPKLFARAGYADEFHMVAQWFPKLAKLEPEGRFASFPYHGHGEFYADFATYELTVVTAADVTVGSSGVLTATRALPDRRVERVYRADRVHDVAFAASRDLTTLDRTCARVHVHVLSPPGYASARDAHLDATCRALAWLGETYGAYPYTDLTVVVPPRGAEGAAGMEYPTLFLTAGLWLDAEFAGIDEARETTLHELVHQWFQGLVATNEVRHAFLDEGITSFVTSDYQVTLAPIARDRRSEAIRPFATATPAPGSHVSAFGDHYGTSVYARSEMILETVARTWGRARVRRALGRYARAQRFRHPTPLELFDAFDATYWPGFSRDVLEPLFMKGETMRPRVHAEGNVLVAERRGTASIPVDVLHETADGVRTLTHLPAGGVARFTGGCVTVDPYRKILLDRRRRDDRACAPDATRRATYVERLAAALAAFVVGVP